jgi:hypothetical protein
MANRAYLYFKEDLEDIGNEDFRNNRFYIDSRHNIPLVWWFFFDGNSVKNYEVKIQSKQWSEVYLATEWELAVDRFRSRMPFIENLTFGLLAPDKLERFISELALQSKKYLILNPIEIFQSNGIEDKDHTKTILSLIDIKNISEFSVSVNQYSHHLNKPYQLEPELHLIGHFYE